MLIVSPWTYNRKVLNEMLSTLEKLVSPFPTAWMDTGSSPRYRTQNCQLLSTLNLTRSLSRNAGLSVSYTNYLTSPQTTSATNLKLHTNLSSNPDTPPVSTSVKPPKFHPCPSSTKSFNSVSYSLLLRKASVIWLKNSFSFCFISISLSDVHPWTLLSVLGKCFSVPLPFLFVSCLSRFSLLYYTMINIERKICV